MEGNSDICEGCSSKVRVAVTERNGCCSVLLKGKLIFIAEQKDSNTVLPLPVIMF